MFHCVHFECPVDPSVLAKSDHEQMKSSAVSASNELLGTNVGVQPMDIVAAAQPAADMQQQQPYLRLQGLRRSSSHDEVNGVDHGDGYGIGLLGRSQTPPSDAL